MRDETLTETAGRQVPPAPKKVVIVDDSRILRAWLRMVLERDARLTVVGEAATAAEARRIIKQCEPDVITLDIEMPGMSGLDFLEKLMTLRPMPVVMFSGATRRNSEATVTALSLGAVDCLLKPTSAIDEPAQNELARRVFAAACSRVQVQSKPNSQEREPSAPQTPRGRLPIVLVGASTGGVGALELFISGLDPTGPPVVIVQHMPGPYLISFSDMLNRRYPQDIGLVRNGEVLMPGQIMLAPGVDMHTEVSRSAGRWRGHLRTGPEGLLHCPSVDRLFASGVKHANDVIAVILTGLGRDGAAGMVSLRTGGAETFGQDEASSTAYGMPGAAFKLGGVAHQLPLARIAAAVNTAAFGHQTRLTSRER